MQTTRKMKSVAINVLAGSLLWTCAAQADIINLTGVKQKIDNVWIDSVDSGDFTTSKGTVTFKYDPVQPTGTGVLEPFVRIQGPANGGTQQGYNTSGGASNDPVFDVKHDIWTHDVTMASLTSNPDTGDFEFILDLDESNGGGGRNRSLISLDGVKLYATNTTFETDESIDSNGDWTGPTGESLLLWDMDEVTDNWLLLDYDRAGAGNGRADMQMVVSNEIMDLGAGYTNFILWSRFGLNEARAAGSESDTSFEEWGQVSYATGTPPGGSGGPVPTPIPAPLALFGLGAAMLGWRVRKQS